MVIVNPAEGVRIITFPDMTEKFKELLEEWYCPEKAYKYATDLQEFVCQNVDFPEDGIYKLEEGVFYRLNIKKCQWEKGKSLQSYVISAKSKAFWKKFSQEFYYLLELFEKRIKKMLCETTSKMFDGKMENTSFVSIDKEGVYTLSVPEENALFNAVSEFVRNREEFMKCILKEVFHSEKMPIFIIDRGITVAAITSDSVTKDIDEKVLKTLLSAYFAPDDVETLEIRLSNAIKYGVDSEEEVGVNEDGKIIINIGGLHVFPFSDNDGKCEIVDDIASRKMLFSAVNQQLVVSPNVFEGSYYEFKDGEASEPDCCKIKTDDGESRPHKDQYTIEYKGLRHTVSVKLRAICSYSVYVEDICFEVNVFNGEPSIDVNDVDLSGTMLHVARNS